MNLGGCDQTDMITKQGYVTVSNLAASFVASPTAGTDPLAVQFTDLSAGGPSNWNWDFGDGTGSAMQHPSHVYNEPGLYDVRLTVSDGTFEHTKTRLGYIRVDELFTDLAAFVEGSQLRPGFEGYYRFSWTNVGTNPAYDCQLVASLPEQVEVLDVVPALTEANGGTGTFTTYDLVGYTLTIPLGTIQPSGWFGGYVIVRVRLPVDAVCGDLLESGEWLMTTTTDVDSHNDRHGFNQDIVCSIDPNDKSAIPIGEGATNKIDPDARLHYLVQFENKPEATADAWYVLVLDTLDPDLDWSTLTIGEISHPDECTSEFDPESGELSLFCDQIMLPPNIDPPEGEGYFTYSISPKPDLPQGTEITNVAWIRFDYNEWLMAPETGPVTRTINYGCCVGKVGDANFDGDPEPTIGDIAIIIDNLFISGVELPCLAEADVNQSGGVSPTPADITIGDIATLIDYMFITGPALTLPDCP
jgi:PKD repeat protein